MLACLGPERFWLCSRHGQHRYIHHRYFIAAYFIKRRLVEMGIPKGITRGMVIFVFACAVAYGAAYLVDLAVS